MHRWEKIIAVFISLLIAVALEGQEVSDRKVSQFAPNSVRLQYAGYIGMLSLGSTWTFKDDKISLEYSFGYSPKQDAEKAIYTNAAKILFTPNLDFNVGNKVNIQPLTIGIASSYTFGNRFGKYRDSDQYPNGYYWWSTSVRVGMVYQAEATMAIKSRYIQRIGFYLETSLWDLGLFSYYGNSNRSHLHFFDIVILGSGCRLYF
jgi:hypothetical protein